MGKGYCYCYSVPPKRRTAGSGDPFGILNSFGLASLGLDTRCGVCQLYCATWLLVDVLPLVTSELLIYNDDSFLGGTCNAIARGAFP